jgi:hypothetical protein
MEFILISFCQALEKIGGDLCGKILWYVEIVNKADVVYSLVYLIHPIPFFQNLHLNCSANNLSPLTDHPSFFIRESVKSPKLQVSRERNQTNKHKSGKKKIFTSRTMNKWNGSSCNCSSPWGEFKLQVSNVQNRKCSMNFPKNELIVWRSNASEHSSKCGINWNLNCLVVSPFQAEPMYSEIE